MSHLTLSLCAYRGVLTTSSGGDGDIVTYKEVYLEKNNFTDKHLLTDGMFEVPVCSSDPISALILHSLELIGQEIFLKYRRF